MEVLETKLENPDAQSTARVVAIVFDTRAHTVRIVDSPEPGLTSLASVLEKRHAVAGVNGGYFEPDFTPVGLVVAGGKTLRAFKQARLLAGIVAVSPNGTLSISRSARFDPKPGAYRDALQCGPMLVEHSAPVSGLNSVKIARRTAVATGPDRHAALIWISSTTLADAAAILTRPGVLGAWKPASALNLDGGSSSGLWARGTVSLPEIKRVRNFLEVVPE